jgi:transcriptional regulator with XRE-family HTH domain
MNTKFTQKRVGTDLSVGQRLEAARRAKKLSIAQVEDRLKIQAHHLENFEADRFDALPEIYLRGFLTRYAEFLGLEAGPLVGSILTERRIKQVSRSNAKPRRRLSPQRTLTPRRLAWSGLLALTLLSLPFVSRGIGVWADPPVIVFDPVFTDERTGETLLKGHIDAESRLWAEGIEVPVKGDGGFSLRVILPSGPNRVDFEVKNRFGKRGATSKVLSVYPAQPASSTDPVAVRVEVVDRPAWITVRSGEQKVFEGLVVPGASQTFYGTEIALSTSDAGATMVSVSNARVQRHDLGRLGRALEAKENLRITPDTEIQ